MNLKFQCRFCILLILGGLLASSVAPAQSAGDKKATLNRAIQAQYGLRHEGLVEFQCVILPNWRSLLAQSVKDPKVMESTVKTLTPLRFSLFMGADDKVKITHNEVTTENDQVAKGLAQIYGGMEQMISGFFDTWSLFVLRSPFPDVNSAYDLKLAAGQYGLSYKEGSNDDVTTTMSQDFVISSVKVVTSEFESVIAPKYDKTPKGLLMTAYEATYNSKVPGEATQLKVEIAYQDVENLKLPQKLNLSGTYGGQPFQVEVTFSECSAKKSGK
ncbi:MAG: hypothetical protein PHX83_13585 [Acidobacteriia bacterium]|nr:hypothetical protein [Terriglobia bacterium]